MGLMQCDRPGCDTVMCLRHSDEFGYICDKCFDEMKERKSPIRIFMKSYKGTFGSRDYDNEFPFCGEGEGR